jgi:hypothetical protein
LLVVFGQLVGFRRRAVFVAFFFGFRGFFDPRADQLPRIAEDFPQFVPQFEILAEQFGDQVPGALQDLFHALHAHLRVDELGGAGLQVGGFRSGVQNFQGQGFQASAASQIGERLLFRLERQIDVFQTTERIRRLDQPRQLVRQFALRLQGFQDPLLAVGQRAPFFHGLVD